MSVTFLHVCRGALFHSNEIQQYAIPFMGSDPAVVKRTQRFLAEEHQDTPVGATTQRFNMETGKYQPIKPIFTSDSILNSNSYVRSLLHTAKEFQN